MLECRPCLQRCLRAVANDTRRLSHHYRPVLTPHLAPSQPFRSASNNTALTRDEPRSLAAGDGLITKHTAKDATTETALKLELRYLRDPLKLADHVRHTLRGNDVDKALGLCRMASKDMACTVSWNHCVDWHMARGKVVDAMKIYNEMKKRAQFPDSHTYLILLRGLSHKNNNEFAVKADHVARAIALYKSMRSPTSRVEPGIIHTNATIKVCAAAYDMDAMWDIASQIPEKGQGSADALTYTIILNAVRLAAMRNYHQGMTDEENVQKWSKAVDEGKRVWEEVIHKWRKGEVVIDEELACAIGRLLLAGKRAQDWDDVLSLVQQTMNVQRMVPRLGEEGRNASHMPDLKPETTVTEDDEGYTLTAGSHFQDVKPLPANPNRSKPASLAWVRPGNNTLSLLLEACTKMWTSKTAIQYWDVLTSSHGLKPDLENYHSYLRMLHQSRASARAVQVVKEGMIASSGLEPLKRTFRIAMSVCTRDKKNVHILDHAWQIVALMQQYSADLDVPTLIAYLSLAVYSDSGPKIVEALNRMEPTLHNLRSRITYGATGEEYVSAAQDRGMKDDAVVLFQSMIGTIDTLMNRGLVPRSDYETWHNRRSRLAAFVQRMKGKMVQRAGQARNGQMSERDAGRNPRAAVASQFVKAFRSAGKARDRETERSGRTTAGPWVDTGFADSPAELGMNIQR